MSGIRKAIAIRLGDPEGAIKLAKKRVESLVQHYWSSQGSLSIDQLAQSCYMQGMDDGFESLRERFPGMKKEAIEPKGAVIHIQFEQ